MRGERNGEMTAAPEVKRTRDHEGSRRAGYVYIKLAEIINWVDENFEWWMGFTLQVEDGNISYYFDENTVHTSTREFQKKHPNWTPPLVTIPKQITEDLLCVSNQVHSATFRSCFHNGDVWIDWKQSEK